MKEVVRIHLAGSEGSRMFGGMSTLWSEGVRDMLGTKENEVCEVWLAPENGDMEEGRVDKEGLLIDVGRRQDCEMVSQSRTYIPR